jgi:uncharacterized membrane protein YsdA (DUF1294 family)
MKASLLKNSIVQFLVFYSAINVFTFALFAFDKHAAVRRYWRISEHTLATFALMGGFAGAYAAMRLFRHKTSKQSFLTMFYMCSSLHLAGCLGLIYYC